jgi:hypothetical protein
MFAVQGGFEQSRYLCAICTGLSRIGAGSPQPVIYEAEYMRL